MLSVTELESQAIVELPDRELMGALIVINGPLIGGPVDVSILENLANHSFNNFTISVLNDNEVDINVSDNLSQNDVDVFCNQVVAVLSAQCRGEVLN